MRLVDLGFSAREVSAARLSALRARPLNYDPSHAGGPGWHRDDYRQPLPAEHPGPPEERGSWRIAARLSRDYAFCDPSLVESHFDREAPLEGRNMLLVLHAFGLRVDAGVRVATAHEEVRSLEGREAHLFAWSYRTLEGHVEAGQRDFEVWKWLDTGDVEFRTHSFSRPASRNPLIRVGFFLIGRHKRAEFGQLACERMAELTRAALGAVLAPGA